METSQEENLDVIERARKTGRGTLSEHESKEILKDYGIPVTREIEVSEEKDLQGAVERIGFPLVLKACGWNVSHKTEKGLVHVDVRTMEEAESGFRQIMEQAGRGDVSVLVQELIRGHRELVIGLTRDPQFGPCVMFGLGGIFAEILEDVSFRVAPFEKSDAFAMMQEIRGKRILEAVRGMPAADLEALAEILVKVGTIGLDQAAVREIDINPIVLSGSRPVALDALVVLEG